ncbi:peptidylprolyl isomerase [Azohydromonas caseinilytica]|uniref:Chaperone SurA n=1 Tax=Azohydromonas caseinilytica TaxID=2728836 RepID=A0A848FEG8_9BURK|nr:peptidylprolyl isomerase [Azohydromonas caseinilytica]NML16291.1 molecular chaperone SurA [Azohydromonas caseinilytica]
MSRKPKTLVLGWLLAACALHASAQSPSAPGTPRTADFIVAVVNQELVTAVELEQRLARIRAEAARAGQRLPPDAQLRQQVLDALIDERVILSYARDTGMRVDEAEIDRAVASVAAQNQITPQQLRERLRQDGIDLPRFRANLRDQIMIERVRERELQQRIKVSDADIDAFIEKQRRDGGGGQSEYNVAQILVPVSEGAPEAEVQKLRAQAEQALQRVRGGEDFAAVAREVSRDDNRERGGEMGMRPAAKLPDVFLEQVRGLRPGQVAPTVLRTGAGFHVLKLVEKRDDAAVRVTQTHARHILLRPSAQLSAEVAKQRLAEYRRQIESGKQRFEEVARAHSQDGSAAQGGDLGWTAPGAFVPEFEQAMNALQPMGLSEPVVSRFGVHLIQVLDRREVAVEPRQLRELARDALREQRFEQAYADWVRELRSRAYVELRESPR